MEYQAQTKNCQNCKKDFIIEPDDFLFYEKIKVPPPTFCPECMLQRRMVFRNERTFYKRKNNAPNKINEVILTIHNPEAHYTIYDDRTWWSDDWNPMDYGQDYDFTKPFFEQFNHLYHNIPLINLSVTNMVNCNLCNVAEGDKDCYMTTASNKNENCFYSNRVTGNKQSGDLYIGSFNEFCYELINSSKNYKLFYSTNTQECSDSFFLFNCKNCSNCIGCINLRNKSYCIFNEQYSEEEYQKIKDSIFLESYEGIKNFNEEFLKFKNNCIHKYSNSIKSFNSTGDNIENVNNVQNSFDIIEAQDSKNVVWGGYGLKDTINSGPGVGIHSELIYDSIDTALDVSNCKWTIVVYHSFDISYSINCHGSSNLFGCYGLRNKKYCILNKQYTKEEYEELVPMIIEHMNNIPYKDKLGIVYKYGEFFPSELSPFAYNETIAQEYFPLDKGSAEKLGFNWYNRPDRDYKITMKNNDIPNVIKNLNDSFIDNIIECKGGGDSMSQCTSAFRILKEELDFYIRLNLPLPRYCPNCRHYNRLKLRNPLKLWHRSCMKEGCTNEFETSYAPGRPEIIYCEECYKKEVY